MNDCPITLGNIHGDSRVERSYSGVGEWSYRSKATAFCGLISMHLLILIIGALLLSTQVVHVQGHLLIETAPDDFLIFQYHTNYSGWWPFCPSYKATQRSGSLNEGSIQFGDILSLAR